MEVPPLGPGDMQYVYEALKCCLNQDVGVRGQGEATLQALEVRPGFCSCLAEITSNKEADHSVRWLAAVHFKNSINKYWRSRLAGSLSDGEKAHLRTKLVELIDQDDSQIAVQLAVVLAKVARLDFPRAWPSLFSDLLGRLQAASAAGSTGVLTVRRCYLALHHILKELASKRLAADQRNFESITSQLLQPLWQQWTADTQTIIEQLPSVLTTINPAAPTNTNAAAQSLLLTMERWLLQLKSLRRMLLFGSPSDAKMLQPVEAVGHAVPSMLNILLQLDGLRGGQASGKPAVRNQVTAMLDRGILKLLKSLRQIQEMHPWSVFHCGTLIPLLEFCCQKVLEADASCPPHMAAMTMHCLICIHAVQRCPSYKGSPASLTVTAGTGRDQLAKLKQLSSQVQQVVNVEFWSHGRIEALTAAIIQRLLPLTEKDLDAWDADAESFHHEQDSTSWEDNIRGCAENTFLVLFEFHREAVAPLMKNLLQSTGNACPPGAPAALAANPTTNNILGVPSVVLAKEAVYAAAAVGSYELQDHIDFSQWLHSALLYEMSDASAAAKPLRRQAMRVVGRWAAKLKKEDRPLAYKVLIESMACDDWAVKLAAVTAMKTLVDDWEFDEQQFLEYVGPCFKHSAELLQSAAEFDSQLEVFNLVNLIIDRLADGVKPYAEGLLQLMPTVWQASEGQSLLRIQILVALQRLVNALGHESPISYPLVLPVLQFCTDPHQPDELNLLEDGLHLWLVALRNAPAYNPGLVAPFPNLLATMHRSTEHIAVGMKLAISSVLLGGSDLLRVHGAALVDVLRSYIGNVKERGMLLLFPVMDIIIQCFPQEGPSLLAPALTALLADIFSGKEPGMVIAPALGVFARVLVHNPASFLSLIATAAPHVALPADAPQAPDPSQRLLLALVDLWLDKFDSIGSLPSRKLSALALCMLLPAPMPAILTRLEIFVAHITAVWFEVEGSGPEAASAMAFYSSLGPRDDDIHAAVNCEEAEGESNRRKALADNDPVKNMVLSVVCKGKMDEAMAVHGAQAVNAAGAALDSTLGEQFQSMLNSVGQ